MKVLWFLMVLFVAAAAAACGCCCLMRVLGVLLFSVPIQSDEKPKRLINKAPKRSTFLYLPLFLPLS